MLSVLRPRFIKLSRISYIVTTHDTNIVSTTSIILGFIIVLKVFSNLTTSILSGFSNLKMGVVKLADTGKLKGHTHPPASPPHRDARRMSELFLR